MAFRCEQKHIYDENTLKSIKRKSRNVKYIEVSKKSKSKFAKYKLTNNTMVIKCRGKKHKSKFEIRIDIEIRVDMKKFESKKKRRLFKIIGNAGQLSCQTVAS